MENCARCWTSRGSKIFFIFEAILANLVFLGGIALVILGYSDVIDRLYIIVGFVMIGISIVTSIILGIISCVVHKYNNP